MSEKKKARGNIVLINIIAAHVGVIAIITFVAMVGGPGITYDGVKKWLELISFACAPIVALAAVFALLQVRAAIQQAKSSLAQTKLLLEQVEISRQDIVLRSRREALGLALEQCKRFAKEIIPQFEPVVTGFQQRKYKRHEKVDREFPFIPKEDDPIGAQIWANDVPFRTTTIGALNELESFAMYFACDLADEQLAFTPTAQTFCHFCEWCATFIGVFRQNENMKLYQNLVKLYAIWKPRLERTVLEEQGKQLEQKLQQLPPDKPGRPLGTKL